jgi:hypothetical protein
MGSGTNDEKLVILLSAMGHQNLPTTQRKGLVYFSFSTIRGFTNGIRVEESKNKNPVVSEETVVYGYESASTLTTDRYKLQTRSLVREGAPKTKSKTIFRQRKGKSKIWSWAPKGCPTPKHTD